MPCNFNLAEDALADVVLAADLVLELPCIGPPHFHQHCLAVVIEDVLQMLQFLIGKRYRMNHKSPSDLSLHYRAKARIVAECEVRSAK